MASPADTDKIRLALLSDLTRSAGSSLDRKLADLDLSADGALELHLTATVSCRRRVVSLSVRSRERLLVASETKRERTMDLRTPELPLERDPWSAPAAPSAPAPSRVLVPLPAGRPHRQLPPRACDCCSGSFHPKAPNHAHCSACQRLLAGKAGADRAAVIASIRANIQPKET